MFADMKEVLIIQTNLCQIKNRRREYRCMPTNTYTSKDFVSDKLLSNIVRIKVGHFETVKGVIYSFVYGHPDRNNDYFEYVQITKQEYEVFMAQEPENVTIQESKEIYAKWVKGRKILCNEFSMNPAAYKPSFSEDEL